MSFIQPIPCDDGGGGGADCCPSIFTGYCLDDGTPIAITILNGVQTTWTNLLTGVVTPGAPPIGTGICPTAVVEVQFEPLNCETDSITVCQGDSPWVVSATDLDIRNLSFATDFVNVQGTVALDAGTLAALETTTVLQGTSPWVVSGVDIDIRSLDCITDSVTVCQGTDPWIIAGSISGTVELGTATLAALETITVNQGTSPWVVSAVALDIRPLDCETDSIEVCQGTSPWVVSGTVELGATTLAALETITVNQGTSPWIVSGTVALDAGTLAALETTTVLQGTSPWIVNGTFVPGDNFVSSLNSSLIPLSGNGAFIGTFESTLPFVEAAIMVFADQASATDGLRLEQSIDGIQFTDVDVYTVPANNGKQYTFALNARFFRVTYTNGPIAQTRFELSTLYRHFGAKGSSHRINDTIITQDDAELVKAVLSGQITGGSFVNVGAEASGFLHTHDEADYAEDTPAVDGSLGQAVLGVRNDVAVPKTTNDGDYTFLATDAAGRIGIADLGGSITIDAVALDIRPLECLIDSVAVAVIKSSLVSNPIQIITGVAAVILAANPNRRTVTIQNTGTEVVKFTYGAIDPTTTVYHFALSPGTAADDGTGVFFVDDQWAGDIRAFSDNPGSIVIMEVT